MLKEYNDQPQPDKKSSHNRVRVALDFLPDAEAGPLDLGDSWRFRRDSCWDMVDFRVCLLLSEVDGDDNVTKHILY